MKLITILFSLLLAWTSIISLSFARDNWEEKGAMMPMAAGALLLFLSLCLLIGAVKKWWRGRFKDQDQRFNIN